MDEQSLNLLIIAAIVIVGMIFLWKITKTILGLALIGLVIGGAYYFWSRDTVDMLGEKSLTYLFGEVNKVQDIKTLCKGKARNEVKCLCVLQPIYEDMNKRLSAKQLRKLRENKAALIKAMKQSFLNKKQAISECLIKHKGSAYIDEMIKLTEAVE